MSGLPVPIRNAHTDVKIPNYDDYRKPDGRSPNARREQEDRNLFHYFMMTNLAWSGCWGAKVIAEMFVTSMSAAADVVALAKIEVKLDTIPEVSATIFFKIPAYIGINWTFSPY